MKYTSFLMIGALTSQLALSATALFSPQSGDLAFEKMYDMISNAKNKVSMTVYSWSEAGLRDAIEKAVDNGAKVRVVLHPSLASKSSVKKWVKELELKGATFKKADMKMHEKFIIVDDDQLVNSSANMSSGARSRYSENWIFFDKDNAKFEANLVKQFTHEFALMWNSAKDIKTHGEAASIELNDYQQVTAGQPSNNPQEKLNAKLLSSSMNWIYSSDGVTETDNNNGVHLDKDKKKDQSGEHTWTVKDEIIRHISKAQKTIRLNLNHFNLKDISDALIEAVKRGIKVELVVDNQEYKSRPNNREMTPTFVKDWRALAQNKGKEVPVRVKYYSLAPSPRYWQLNHHKYITIDAGTKKPVLITGSYNLSTTAEQSQYDNMIIFEGNEYDTLINAFEKEFEVMWSYGRNEKDQPIKELIDQMFETNEHGNYRLHYWEPVSLSWEEIEDIRAKLNKVAPGILYIPYKKRDCMYFNPKSRDFSGC